MNAETERNRAIYEECLNGATFSAVARKYSITPSRVKGVFEREAKREQNRLNPVFILLESLCEEEQLYSKTVTVLERIEATTEEAILALDRKKLKKTRNCGQVMEDLLMKMKEEIEKKDIS